MIAVGDAPAAQRLGQALRSSAAAVAIALLLGACEGVGIPASDDPSVMVSQADSLRSAGRIFQVRRLVVQAIAVFEQRGDRAGLAVAYRQYGLIARVGGANADPVVTISVNGAPLSSTLVLTPKEKESEALEHSDEYLTRAVALGTEAKRFDVVTNADYLLGFNQVLRGDSRKACPFYDRALAASRDTEAQQPGTVVDLARARSPAEFLEGEKSKAGCPPSAVLNADDSHSKVASRQV